MQSDWFRGKVGIKKLECRRVRSTCMLHQVFCLLTSYSSLFSSSTTCTCQLVPVQCIYNYNLCLLLVLIPPLLPPLTIRVPLPQFSSSSSSSSSPLFPPFIRPIPVNGTAFILFLPGGRFLLIFAVQTEQSTVSSLKAFLKSYCVFVCV